MIVGPIFAREVLTTPRRPRHYLLRCAYLTLFFVLMWTAWQSLFGFQIVQRISDFAGYHQFLFIVFSYTQLTLILFGASLYGTSSVSHEKDRRTFVLLLITRLEDSEIVVNKFLCGLLQVSAVLLVQLPVFMFLLLFGGISLSQVIQVFAVTFGATFVTGAVGVFIAVWREKTFQAVAMSFLALALSLLSIEVIAGLAGGQVIAGIPVNALCACLSPFRAIASISDPFSETLSALPIAASWIYLALMLAISIAVLVLATIKLRVWNPRGEPIQQPDEDEKAKAADPSQPKKDPFRKVWDNPVLWREIRTRAYGTKPIIVKLGFFLVFGILLGGLLMVGESEAGPRVHFYAVRSVLPLTVIALLLVNAQSVSAVTSERDIKSIDLLLATDITPREFVYGKIIGVLTNMKEMVVLPIVLLGVSWWTGLIGPDGFWYSTIMFLVFVMFAVVLGVHASFRYNSTKLSLANSLGTMFLLFVGMLICLFLILFSGRFEAQWASFIVFIVLGGIGLWVSLRANAPSNAIGLTATIAPIATFFCIVDFIVGNKAAPFMVGTSIYSFAVLALLIPLLAEFDVATGRTTADG